MIKSYSPKAQLIGFLRVQPAPLVAVAAAVTATVVVVPPSP